MEMMMDGDSERERAREGEVGRLKNDGEVERERMTNLLQRGRDCNRDSGGEQENGEKGRFREKRAD